MFPDKSIFVEAPCLDCGEPLRITVRNGVIEREEPRGIRFYVDVPAREWGANLPFAGSRMNLFRSEEHVRRRSGFRAEAAAGLLLLAEAMDIMSVPRFRERLNGHYVSSAPASRPAFVERLKAVSRDDPFWDPTPR